MSRLVYFDLQDGNGFRNVSSLIKYDSLKINVVACSDNHHYAQNTASFELLYDSVLFGLIQANTADIIVKIFNSDPLYPMFYGHIPQTRAYTYNGIVGNIVMSLEAVDDGDYLNVPVGSNICYRWYQVMNYASPSTSIVHQLAYLAGFTFAEISETVIPEILNAFVPPSKDDSVKDLLDALLFEYGYILNFDENGLLSPVKWISAVDSTSQFTDNNIIGELGVDDTFITHKGAEVVYYELTDVSTTTGQTDILLYSDNELPYADTFGFAGYTIVSGTTYPPITNAIDETTGTYTVAYQEYDDTAVNYWTNSAIKNKLDYNYKAFTSDFSSIVATSGWYLSYQAESNIELLTLEVYNTKARIVYKSNGDTNNKLYSSRIYGKVLYKSAERTSKVEVVENSTDIDRYVSTFIFDKVYADVLVKAIAAQYDIPQKTYKVRSETVITVGELVDVVTGDGTSAVCQVISRSYDESTQIYAYILRCYSSATPDLYSQTITYASSTASVSSVIAQMDTIASDSKVTPQEKPLLSQQWAMIEGNGSSTGSYWQVRTAAMDRNVNTGSLDYHYGALKGYLLYSPGVIAITTWSSNIMVDSAVFRELWAGYYAAESQTMSTAAIWGTFGSIYYMNCGEYGDSSFDNIGWDCGVFTLTGEEIIDCGVHSGAAQSTIDCSVYDGSITVDTMDCGIFVTTGVFAPEPIIDCGIFGDLT